MKIEIKGNCPQCGAEWTVEVEEKDWVDYTENGKLAQYAFPYLDQETREFLISGICQRCWDDLFGVEPDIDNIDTMALYAMEDAANYDD
ncbi:MAG: hypothetical protein IJU02_07340 [Lachnospiraceae bacterium]|nr:hypothetical protein [Lachnospiraceae bacterium]